MVYIDNWDRATGYDDETSLDGVASYLFGRRPKETQILNVNYGVQYAASTKLGQYYKTINGGNMYLDSAIAQFLPVNGICFWDMYGKATHTVADTTQTIVNMTTAQGAKPKKKSYQQWDATYAVDMFGLVTEALKLQYDSSHGLLATQSMKGGKVAASSATPDAATLPDDSSNDPVDGAFDVFDSWKWNNVTMEKPQRWTMDVQQAIHPHMKGSDTYYTGMSEHNPIVTGFTMGAMGTTGFSDLWTDYWAQTKRTLKWKMLKQEDVSKYFEVTASNVLCHGINPVRERGAVMGYTAGFIAENVSIVVTDDLDDDWYTIKT